MGWFLRLMDELGITYRVGHPASIRKAETRKQKHDRRDAALLLQLLLEDRFPAIWMPSSELGIYEGLAAPPSSMGSAHSGAARLWSNRRDPPRRCAGRRSAAASSDRDRSTPARPSLLTADPLPAQQHEHVRTDNVNRLRGGHQPLMLVEVVERDGALDTFRSLILQRTIIDHAPLDGFLEQRVLAGAPGELDAAGAAGQAVAGSTTSARYAVSVRKMSWTTR